MWTWTVPQLYEDWSLCTVTCLHVGRTTWTRVLGHMRTVKVQISLHIYIVWSEPTLSANRIIRHYKMYQETVNARMRLCAFVGWIFQQAHNVKMTSYQRRCDVITSHRRWYDVILTHRRWYDVILTLYVKMTSYQRRSDVITCTLKWRRINVDATWSRRIDVDTTPF